MKKVFAVLMSLFMVFSLTGCDSKETNKQLENWSRQFVDGMIAGDFDMSFAVAQNLVSAEDFESIFNHYSAILSGTQSYEVKQLGWNYERKGGVTTYMATFLFTSDNGDYLIELVDISNTELPDNIIFGTREEIEPYLKPY